MKNLFSNTELAFQHLSNAQLRRSIFLFRLFQWPFLTKLGSSLMAWSLKSGLPVGKIIKSTVFTQFCAGESLMESHETAVMLSQSNVGSILDYSVEGEQHEEDFEKNALNLQNAIRKAAKYPEIYPFAVFKSTAVGNTQVLTKVTMDNTLSALEMESYQNWKNRMYAICELSSSLGLPILVDAEETYIQGAIDKLVIDLMKSLNKQKAMVFNTVQLYRKEGLDIVKKIYLEAEKHEFFAGFKLVRGAYLEKEQKWAENKKIPNPINPSKKATDEMFDDAVVFCMKNLQKISICAGTHNELSTLKIIDLMHKMKLKNNDKRVWFAQLLGMSDNLTFVLANEGYNSAKYLPFGPVKEVMPYLIRRAEENSAVAGQMGRELKLLLKERKRRH